MIALGIFVAIFTIVGAIGGFAIGWTAREHQIERRIADLRVLPSAVALPARHDHGAR